MTERDRLWLELEKGLSALIEQLAVSLDAKNLELLRDFVSNREYGVCLEWLYSVVTERAIVLSPSQKEEFERLAQLMGIRL